VTAPISAIVVAGGESRRLGQDKRFLRLRSSQTLLEATVSTVATLTDDVLVVVSTDPARFAALPARVVQDPCHGAGPLNALVAGLAAMRHDTALVVACDLPFLNPTLLRALLEQPRDYDLLAPRRADGRLEMLHAVYRKTCLDPARRRLADGRLRMAGLIDDVRTRIVEEATLRRYDPTLRSFLNVNTPDDLRLVAELLARADGRVPPTVSPSDDLMPGTKR